MNELAHLTPSLNEQAIIHRRQQHLRTELLQQRRRHLLATAARRDRKSHAEHTSVHADCGHGSTHEAPSPPKSSGVAGVADVDAQQVRAAQSTGTALEREQRRLETSLATSSDDDGADELAPLPSAQGPASAPVRACTAAPKPARGGTAVTMQPASSQETELGDRERVLHAECERRLHEDEVCEQMAARLDVLDSLAQRLQVRACSVRKTSAYYIHIQCVCVCVCVCVYICVRLIPTTEGLEFKIVTLFTLHSFVFTPARGCEQ